MSKSIRAIALLLWALSTLAYGGPKEDTNAVVDRWSAVYSANDVDAVVAMYAPDAILLGTVSPVMSEGTEAIRTYFSALKGSGNTNRIGERRTILLDDEAVMVTGFYEFSGMKDGKAKARPSRFTMLVRKSGGQWLVAHHHSTPHVQPAKQNEACAAASVLRRQHRRRTGSRKLVLRSAD
jgi:uncharacterized protein (TIGR02246 family)